MPRQEHLGGYLGLILLSMDSHFLSPPLVLSFAFEVKCSVTKWVGQLGDDFSAKSCLIVGVDCPTRICRQQSIGHSGRNFEKVLYYFEIAQDLFNSVTAWE